MRHRLEIQFLGTGGAFTDFRENYHNNAAIKTDDGWLLIDCGGTAVQSLKELGIPLNEVAGVIITHCHGDHIGGPRATHVGGVPPRLAQDAHLLD